MFSDFSKPENGNQRPAAPGPISAIQRYLLFSLVAVLLCGSLGCRCVETFHTAYVDGPIRCYRDRVWAERAYNIRFGKCQRGFENHFERGFVEGYSDVSQGGDGYVPAMPPRAYWGSEYQTDDGAQCVDTWFDGYPAGAAAAQRDKAGTYHEIFVSKMMASAITQQNETPVKKRNVRTGSPGDQNSAGVREASARNAPIPVSVDPSVDERSKIIPARWKMR